MRSEDHLWADTRTPRHLRLPLHTCFPSPCPAATPAPPLLQGGDRGFVFSSGMAALAAVTRLLSSGDHIVAGDDIYGGTSRLLSRIVPNAGITVTNVDTTDLE
jgi:hypothetical protein